MEAEQQRMRPYDRAFTVHSPDTVPWNYFSQFHKTIAAGNY